MKNRIIDDSVRASPFMPTFNSNGEMNSEALQKLCKEVQKIQERAQRERDYEKLQERNYEVWN